MFSYFSPFYRVHSFTPPPVGPEFQALNASTALARANFAYRVEALNQALFRGEMDSSVRGLLTTAANASTSLASRVRSALYAAAAAPQRAVQR